MKIKRSVFAFILLLLLFFSLASSAQRNYFTSATPSGGTTESGSIAGGDYRATLFTFLWSSPSVELKTNTPFVGGTTTFIKVSLSALSDITVDAYFNNSVLPKPDVQLINSIDETYLAVTPTSGYNSIKIALNPEFLNSIYVYNGFNGHRTDCGQGWATGSNRVSNSGTTMDPTSKVNNSTNAVDASQSSFSYLYLKAQQRNVVISQTIYFSMLGNSTDMLRLYLSETPGFSRNSAKATVQAFLQSTPVTSAVDVFPFVPQTGTKVAMEFSPGAPFDRVTISITSNSNANQNYALNVHEAEIVPAKPVLSLSSTEFCEDAPENISISNPVSGLQYKWYDGTAPISNPLPASYSPTQLPVGPHVLNVTASRPGCPESPPATVSINVNPKPITPEINPIN